MADQLLHPTVLVHFRDPAAFQQFALAYVLDLFDKDTSDPQRAEHFYYVPLLSPSGNRVVVRLGRFWEMNELLRNFLSAENAPVREKVRQRFERQYEKHRAQPQYPSNFQRHLKHACDTLNFPAPPTASQDVINRPHLKLAIQSVVEQYAMEL